MKEKRGDLYLVSRLHRQDMSALGLNPLRKRRRETDRWKHTITWQHIQSERRGHIPSPNANGVSPKKEGKGEGSLVSRAPRQHVCTSPENELCEQRGD